MSFLGDIVNQDDPLQVVMRSHLILERLLLSIIESVLAIPSAIDLQDIPFNRRVDLAIALGVLPEDMRARFKHVNSIRNRFAHSLESDITDKDISNLEASLLRHDKEALGKTSYREMDNVGKFGGVVMVTYFRLEQIHGFLHQAMEPEEDAQQGVEGSTSSPSAKTRP